MSGWEHRSIRGDSEVFCAWRHRADTADTRSCLLCLICSFADATVSSTLKTQIVQARTAKKMTQAQLAQVRPSSGQQPTSSAVAADRPVPTLRGGNHAFTADVAACHHHGTRQLGAHAPAPLPTSCHLAAVVCHRLSMKSPRSSKSMRVRRPSPTLRSCPKCLAFWVSP